MKDTPDIPNDLKELFRQVAEKEKEESSKPSAVKNTTDKNGKIPNITNSRAASYSDRTILNETIKKTAKQHGTVEDESWLLSYNVRKDLGKVSFGKHEIDYGFGDLNMPGFEKGFDELKENLTVMWCGARGYEDEIPVAFCIYKDNHGRLRAYIPTHGNVWNYFSKGSYEIDDMPDYSYDMKLMRGDACKRIFVDPKTIPLSAMLTEGGGLDPSKLPPGMSITDALRGIARGQEMSQTAKDKEGTDILRTIQDLIEQDDIKKNGKIDTNVQTIDWKRIPNFAGFKKGEFSDLTAGQKIWKKEIANGGLVNEDLSYKTSFDRHFDFDVIRKHKTFKEYDDKASPNVARNQWLNKEYAKKNPSKTDMLFKFVKKGKGRFGYEFIIDKKTEKIIMVCFQDVELN